MGLDIYLCSRDQAAANDAHAAASNVVYGRSDYDQLTDAQRDDLHKAIPPYAPSGDVPSERYPDHLFNRRYLRSSYNGGGFNRAVTDFVGADHDLYWIFEPMGREWDGDDGIITETDVPALRKARKRAEQVADELRAADPLRVMSESPMLGDRDHMWSRLPGEHEVLAWYRDEKARHADRADGDGYANAKGLVLGFAKGLEVLAVTLCRDVLGRPAAAVVYRPDGETVESYVQSAEIVVEFCDEAIALIERDGSARMSWSG